MKYLISLKIIFLWTIFFIFFIYFSFNENYSKKYIHTILPAPAVREQIPAGEIVTGFHIQQSINWNYINVSTLNQSATFCINLLMANYNNRSNSGIFSLTLRNQKFLQKKIINSQSVRDNTNQIVCYDKLPLPEIAFTPTILILEGIDSNPGKAVSAWLTSDTTFGIAQRDGVVLGKSLVFSIDVINESNGKLMQVILLTILCGLSISILFWPTNSKSCGDTTAMARSSNQ
ncbi:hypothetical protein [Collimonas arenae]|uniref:hypothetical protein n=1 Tax=Collimonas arenae TaxID=279058 RepID=UPI00056DB159|nr:hypothetical protein [Collimonas arenae]